MPAGDPRSGSSERSGKDEEHLKASDNRPVTGTAREKENRFPQAGQAAEKRFATDRRREERAAAAQSMPCHTHHSA